MDYIFFLPTNNSCMYYRVAKPCRIPTTRILPGLGVWCVAHQIMGGLQVKGNESIRSWIPCMGLCILLVYMCSKITTTVVSHFAASYVFYWSTFFPSTPLMYPPSFDARLVAYPNLKCIRDYLSWRQVDCHINNLYNTSFWALVDSGMSPEDSEKKLRVSAILVPLWWISCIKLVDIQSDHFSIAADILCRPLYSWGHNMGWGLDINLRCSVMESMQTALKTVQPESLACCCAELLVTSCEDPHVCIGPFFSTEIISVSKIPH